jgi:hypothetical protein
MLRVASSTRPSRARLCRCAVLDKSVPYHWWWGIPKIGDHSLRSGLTRHRRDMQSGHSMAAKTAPQKANRKASGPKSKGASKAGPTHCFELGSKTCLAEPDQHGGRDGGLGHGAAGLLAAKHFQIAPF